MDGIRETGEISASPSKDDVNLEEMELEDGRLGHSQERIQLGARREYGIEVVGRGDDRNHMSVLHWHVRTEVTFARRSFQLSGPKRVSIRKRCQWWVGSIG